MTTRTDWTSWSLNMTINLAWRHPLQNLPAPADPTGYVKVHRFTVNFAAFDFLKLFFCFFETLLHKSTLYHPRSTVRKAMWEKKLQKTLQVVEKSFDSVLCLAFQCYTGLVSSSFPGTARNRNVTLPAFTAFTKPYGSLRWRKVEL